ncbi:hypothetical protein NtB2_00542 [Lactococcus termiticola]|uniref:Uncharacterized protein n=1 Tax=Lactococcus termiticola TaxID=2169526 RepID=A0A2R5HJ10_9LACT|nr:hypothetical protein NtB2_00542 [Lactococcus termiticola]
MKIFSLILYGLIVLILLMLALRIVIDFFRRKDEDL